MYSRLRPTRDYDTFADLLGEPSRSGDVKSSFTKGQAEYDALILGINPALAQSFYPLFDEPWLKHLGAFAEIELSCFDGALAEEKRPVFPDRSRCDYLAARQK